MNNLEIVTSWHTIINLAKAVGNASKLGDTESYNKTKKELEVYEQLVLKSDKMLLGISKKDIE